MPGMPSNGGSHLYDAFKTCRVKSVKAKRPAWGSPEEPPRVPTASSFEVRSELVDLPFGFSLFVPADADRATRLHALHHQNEDRQRAENGGNVVHLPVAEALPPMAEDW